jgi:hypothetical protein
MLPSYLAQKALERDDRCVFSGVSSTDSDAFAVAWIFPPFEGYTVKCALFYDHRSVVLLFPWLRLSIQQLPDDPWLERKYRYEPDTIY